MSGKQKLFIAEYLVDLNATQAALRAGYSPKTAFQTGAENLKKPKIAAALAIAQAERSARTAVSADKVIRELAAIGFSDVRRLFAADGSLLSTALWPDDVAAAVASVEVSEEFSGSGESRVLSGHIKKIRLWDKTKGLEMLAKHLGMLVDRVKHEGDAIRFVIEGGPPVERAPGEPE